MTPIDVLTPTEKEELAVFVHGWKAGEKAVQTPFTAGFKMPPALTSQEPCFGKYPANLLFPNEQDTQTALDLQAEIRATTDSRILRFLMSRFEINLVTAAAVSTLFWVMVALVAMVLWSWLAGK